MADSELVLVADGIDSKLGMGPSGDASIAPFMNMLMTGGGWEGWRTVT